MRILSSALIATSLTIGLISGATAAHASAPAQAQRRAPNPVVIEWFSQPSASVGQREVVYVRLLDRNRPLAGARLTAHLWRGKTALLVLHGSATDRAGEATASFIVPPRARGAVIQVVVSLSYRNYHFPGRNQLKVRK